MFRIMKSICIMFLTIVLVIISCKEKQKDNKVKIDTFYYDENDTLRGKKYVPR